LAGFHEVCWRAFLKSVLAFGLSSSVLARFLQVCFRSVLARFHQVCLMLDESPPKRAGGL
jgi:hypothetical protein